MNNNLKISIIIIGYNTSKELVSLLNSINSLQGANHVLEVIYIDDGSIDNSVQIFNSFKLKFRNHCIKHSKNLGRNYARNTGIINASEDWCLFMNSNI